MSEPCFPRFSELPNELQMAIWDYAIKDALQEEPADGPSPPLSFYFSAQSWLRNHATPFTLQPKIVALYTRSAVFIHPLWYRTYARDVLNVCLSSRLLVIERAYNVLVKLKPSDGSQRLLQRLLEDIMWDLYGRLGRRRGHTA